MKYLRLRTREVLQYKLHCEIFHYESLTIASSIIEYGLGYHGSLQSTTTTTVTASPTASISTFTSVVVVTPTPVAPRTVCFLHDDIL